MAHAHDMTTVFGVGTLGNLKDSINDPCTKEDGVPAIFGGIDGDHVQEKVAQIFSERHSGRDLGSSDVLPHHRMICVPKMGLTEDISSAEAFGDLRSILLSELDSARAMRVPDPASLNGVVDIDESGHGSKSMLLRSPVDPCVLLGGLVADRRKEMDAGDFPLSLWLPIQTLEDTLCSRWGDDGFRVRICPQMRTSEHRNRTSDTNYE